MSGLRFDGKWVMTTLAAFVTLALAGPLAHAAGTISINKAVMVEKDAPNTEVPSGYADAYLSVDFRGDATCSCTCDDSNITYTWHFGDTTTAEGKNASRTYGFAGAGDREPFLHVECSCGAPGKDSPKLSAIAIRGIRVDRIGDKENPTDDGRLCFNTERCVKATALPEGVTGSDKIDWSLQIAGAILDVANSAGDDDDPTIPSLADEDWPTYNGAPAWGAITLYISIDGPHVAGQQNELKLTGAASFVTNPKTIEKFFDETGTQNLGTGNPPNWYYYWKQTTAYYESVGYESGPFLGICYFVAGSPGTWQAFCQTQGHTTGWTDKTGIDCFARTCRHEWQHKVDFDSLWGVNSPRDANKDQDNDYLHDDKEGTFDGDFAYDKTKYATFDGLRDCEHHAEHRMDVWDDGSANTADWAHPGKQWP